MPKMAPYRIAYAPERKWRGNKYVAAVIKQAVVMYRHQSFHGDPGRRCVAPGVGPAGDGWRGGERRVVRASSCRGLSAM